MTPTGHKVLITGASKGIGFALAKRFYEAGNTAVLVGRSTNSLALAAQQLPGATICVADIADAQDRASIVSSHPDITVLINNAGIHLVGDFMQMGADDIHREMDINLVGPVLLTHAYLPLLQQQKASAIVNVSSTLALMPKQSASIYSATKAGLHSFTQSLRWQLAHTSVRVFEIIPPLVDTAMTAASNKPKLSPDALADAFWPCFVQDEFSAPIGKAKAAQLLVRWLPAVAEKMLRHG